MVLKLTTYLYILSYQFLQKNPQQKKLPYYISLSYHAHIYKNSYIHTRKTVCLCLLNFFNIKFERFELEWPFRHLSFIRVLTKRIYLYLLDFYLPANFTTLPAYLVFESYQVLRLNTQKYNTLSNIYCLFNKSTTFFLYTL